MDKTYDADTICRFVEPHQVKFEINENQQAYTIYPSRYFKLLLSTMKWIFSIMFLKNYWDQFLEHFVLYFPQSKISFVTLCFWTFFILRLLIFLVWKWLWVHALKRNLFVFVWLISYSACSPPIFSILIFISKLNISDFSQATLKIPLIRHPGTFNLRSKYGIGK